ncbi:hypothetical protein [Sphingobacterium puteale]|uniref:hypothetical protein n=1 Tax=Sphingobacterium puteale TaxID=2420510 RepID=UPI003D953EAB
MIKFNFILLFIVLFSQAKGQSSIIFKLNFHPNQEYEYTTKTSTKVTINFEGNQDLIDALKLQGFNLPATVISESEIKSITRTKKKKDNKIPFSMEYVSIDAYQNFNNIESKIENPLEGTIIYGNYENKSQSYLSTVDSIINYKLDTKNKNLLKHSIEKLVDTVYTEIPIGLGQSFKKEAIMEVPIPNYGQLKFITTTRYTLKEITNGKAYFETVIDLKPLSSENLIEILSTGGGHGNTVYDIMDNIVTNNKIEYTIPVKIKRENLTITAQINIQNSDIVIVKR